MNQLRQALFMLVAMGATTAPAEVVLDGTLGTSGSLTGPDYEITQELGQSVGANLFHSFDTFNLDTGESATFSGSSSIENVIARVTGGESSWIDGTIGSTIAGADLWLINPWGVVFGEHASLDLGGSFYLSTADYLKLGEGGSFSASAPAESLLVSAAPEAFGFLGESPAGITLEGTQITTGAGESLILVGGDLAITAGARLNVGSGVMGMVATAAAGEVAVATLTPDSGMNGGAIVIADGSNLDLSGEVGGALQLWAADLTLEEGGQFNASVAGSGGGMTIMLEGTLLITGENSRIFQKNRGEELTTPIAITAATVSVQDEGVIATSTTGDGTGGALNLEVATLELSGGGIISTTSLGTGTGGDITITAERVAISGQDADGTNSSINVEINGSGDGGTITIDTVALELTAGGLVSSSSFGAGTGGAVDITATTVTIDGESSDFDSSGIYADASDTGDGGTITITADQLQLGAGGTISSSSYGAGDGGAITVLAGESLTISGAAGDGRNSGIASDTQGSGAGGDIYLEVADLLLTAGGVVSATTFGSGRGGTLTLVAGELTITGISSDNDSSGVYADSVTGSGAAGDILISVDSLEMSDHGKISATTYAAGEGGSITITATAGVAIAEGAGILAQVGVQGSGDGGEILITTPGLELLSGGVITATTYGSGAGGTITITAEEGVAVTGADSRIVAQSGAEASGGGGDIMIVAGALELSDAGVINASTYGAGTGGTITIEVVNGVTVAEESGIAAQVGEGASGAGGEVLISARSLEVTEGGVISATTYGAGMGGTLTLLVEEGMVISGTDSRITALSGSAASGGGGDIVIVAGSLEVSEEGAINASTYGTGAGGTVAITAETGVTIAGGGIHAATYAASDGGAGGDISINADSITVSDSGLISARSTGSGSGGGITLIAGETILVQDGAVATATVESEGGDVTVTADYSLILEHGSITTSVADGAGSGGNIVIDPEFVILSHSSIIANAHAGSGGNITIVADNFLSDPGSVISASSELGVDGNVVIDSPTVDVSGGLLVMNDKGGDVRTMVVRCASWRTFGGDDPSSFKLVGGGGVPLLSGGELFPSWVVEGRGTEQRLMQGEWWGCDEVLEMIKGV